MELCLIDPKVLESVETGSYLMLFKLINSHEHNSYSL